MRGRSNCWIVSAGSRASSKANALISVCAGAAHAVGLPLNGHRGHLAAFFSAAATRFGTTLTVLVVMPCTFFGAGVANFRALTAEVWREFRAPRHELGGHCADEGTVEIETDTSRHFLNAVLLKAGACAVFTFDGAVVTCIDAFLVFLMWHSLCPLF